MPRIRVDTEQLRKEAGVLAEIRRTIHTLGNDIASIVAAMPSYEGQLSGPAHVAGFEAMGRAWAFAGKLGVASETLTRLSWDFEFQDDATVDALYQSQQMLQNIMRPFPPEEAQWALYLKGDGDADPVSEKDICQGYLGDCTFLSALAALAMRRPDLIRRMIRDNGNGTYTVTFYQKSGVAGFIGLGGYSPVEITVDSNFELNPDMGFPGATPNDFADGKAEIWPLVIERAYIKFQGGKSSYIEGKPEGEALTALTGKESEKRTPADVPFDQFANAFDRGDILLASSLPGPYLWVGDHPLYKDNTLVTRHAYYVTGVNRNAQTVTLGNPWNGDLPPIVISYHEYQQNYIHTTILSAPVDEREGLP
jgi:hypothetical protein